MASALLVASPALASPALSSPPSLGIVVVTSPSNAHPSTSLIWGALGSTSLLRGVQDAPIEIVCDGYRTPADLEPSHSQRALKKLSGRPTALSKRGIVSAELGSSYEEYKRQLREEIDERGLGWRIDVDECESHQGFALCVRRGLMAMQRRGLRFALVLQHDRAFIRRFSEADLRRVLRQFDDDETTRYVGFATSTSKLQSTRLQPRYKLNSLLEARTHTLRPGLLLRPSIFWFDSSHVVDVDRALPCLYEPFTCAPPFMHARCADAALAGTPSAGGPGGAGSTDPPLPGGLGSFTLRRGDFIEDRFGVAQRALLASLHDRPDELMETFDFFGSYLLEETVLESDDDGSADGDRGVDDDDGDGPATVCELVDARARVSHVAHMDGRSSAPREWLSQLPLL